VHEDEKNVLAPKITQKTSFNNSVTLGLISETENKYCIIQNIIYYSDKNQTVLKICTMVEKILLITMS
jgi:hypothetical protein